MQSKITSLSKRRQMKQNLEYLQQLMRQYHLLVKEKRILHKKWVEWNGWARNEGWYFDWAAENGLSPSDLKAASSKHAGPYDREDGYPLFKARNQVEYELNLLRVDRSETLRRLYNDRTGNNWTYSLDQIAKAYGQNKSATNFMLSTQPWFVPRMELEGHRWKNTN